MTFLSLLFDISVVTPAFLWLLFACLLPSFTFFFCLFLLYLGLYLWHMESPRLEVQLELKLPAYATGIAMWDPSCICSLYHTLGTLGNARSLFFFVFRALPAALGGSHPWGLSGVVATGLCWSHSNARSKLLHLRPTPIAHGNSGSLTHWVRPGIESTCSWILIGFVSTEP